MLFLKPGVRITGMRPELLRHRHGRVHGRANRGSHLDRNCPLSTRADQ